MEKSYVYFIQAKSGPIKIGLAMDPQKRFGLFCVGHYEELKLLGVIPGLREDEQRIHGLVAGSLIRGEWFNPTAEVLALVAKTVPPPQFKLPGSARIARPSELEDINRAIIAADGNLGKVAEMLGCARRTLTNRMRALGLPYGKAGRRNREVGHVLTEAERKNLEFAAARAAAIAERDGIVSEASVPIAPGRPGGRDFLP